MKINISLSAIPLKTYKKWAGHGAFNRERYSELFRKFSGDRHAYRIYLPVDGPSVNAPIAVVPTPISSKLEELGYVVDDYRSGIAVDSKTGSKKIKIGKLLPEDLLKQFVNDPQRATSRVANSKLLVVISRHPYDIAGMSTGRGWTSCMDLKGGQNKRYVIRDVKHGTLVAYLINAEDKNIERPIARTRIYAFALKEDELGKKVDAGTDDVLFVREPTVYGASNPKFIEVVENWIAAANKDKADGLYALNPSLYTDQIPHENVAKMSDVERLELDIKNDMFDVDLSTAIMVPESEKNRITDALITRINTPKTSNIYRMLPSLIKLVPVDRQLEVFKALAESKPYNTFKTSSRTPINRKLNLPIIYAFNNGLSVENTKTLLKYADVDLEDEIVFAQTIDLPNTMPKLQALYNFFNSGYFKDFTTSDSLFLREVFADNSIDFGKVNQTEESLVKLAEQWLADDNDSAKSVAVSLSAIKNGFDACGIDPMKSAGLREVLSHYVYNMGHDEALKKNSLYDLEASKDVAIQGMLDGDFSFEEVIRDYPGFERDCIAALLKDVDVLLYEIKRSKKLCQALTQDDLETLAKVAKKNKIDLGIKSVSYLTSNKNLDVTVLFNKKEVIDDIAFTLRKTFPAESLELFKILGMDSDPVMGNLVKLLTDLGVTKPRGKVKK